MIVTLGDDSPSAEHSMFARHIDVALQEQSEKILQRVEELFRHQQRIFSGITRQQLSNQDAGADDKDMSASTSAGHVEQPKESEVLHARFSMAPPSEFYIDAAGGSQPSENTPAQDVDGIAGGFDSVPKLESEGSETMAVPRKVRASTNSDIDEDMKMRIKAEKRHSALRAEMMDTSLDSEDMGRGLVLDTLTRTVRSWHFEVLFAFIILSNSVLIGAQVEYSATHVNDPTPLVFQVLNFVYVVLFTIELILRILAEGCCQFFVNSQNLAWNYLDLLIVGSSLFETAVNGAVLFETGHSSEGDADFATASNMRIIRILRITRLARVLRIIKVIRFIRALRTLVHSIMVTLKSLAWALLLLTLIIYVFGILFTDAVTGYLADLDKSKYEEAALSFNRFRSLETSMNTLFRCVSDGLDWDNVAEPLAGIHWLWGYLFSAFMAFSLFAVLNVMTGVFCQSAQESAQRDHDLLVQSMVMDRQRNLDLLKEIFETIENGDSGVITLVEFEEKFEDDSFRAFFQSLDLEPRDAWTLFKLLDTEGTGDVDAMEFVEGCMKLKGPAKSIDIAGLMHECNIIKKRLKQTNDHLKKIERATAKSQK